MQRKAQAARSREHGAGSRHTLSSRPGRLRSGSAHRSLLVAAVVMAAIAAGLALALRAPSRAAEELPGSNEQGARSGDPAYSPPGHLRSGSAPRSQLMAPEQYMGVGSCASPACHGGPTNGPHAGNEWKSSYTVWVERDPHAGAYNVLQDEQSRNILCALDNKPTADCQPWNDSRCLACHSTAGRTSQDGRAFERDGVGCEACHGPARGWLAEHTAYSWDNLSPKERAAKGMFDTREIGVCAATCADCHVGSPGRDMNHDMIAAGHPRLTFELSAFLANMPHHWMEKGTRLVSRNGPEGALQKRAASPFPSFPSQVWAVGQIALSESALRLLAARAGAAKTGGPWPEFSEYDCYGCHHSLSLDGYRQKMLGRAWDEHRATHSGERLGSYRWATWHLPLTRLLLEECRCAAAKSALTSLDRLAASLQRPLPAPESVSRDAQSASEALQVILCEPNRQCFDEQLVDRVLRATAHRPATDWDEACGQYLLFRSACGAEERFNAPLDGLRDFLQFRDQPRPDGPPLQYLSPAQSLPGAFDPRKFNEKIDAVRKLLPRQRQP